MYAIIWPICLVLYIIYSLNYFITGGLLMMDVTNPLKPTFISCFGTDGYVHDAQCVNYHGPDTRLENILFILISLLIISLKILVNSVFSKQK